MNTAAIDEKFERADYRLAVTLRALRSKCGFTQRDVSRLSGITQPTVARIERGEQKPSVTSLLRLLDAYDASMTIDASGERVQFVTASEIAVDDDDAAE